MPKKAASLVGSEDTLRERIKYERELRGMTLADLARAMNIHGTSLDASGIWKIENTKRAIRVDELVALSYVFELSADELLIPVAVATDIRAQEKLRVIQELIAKGESLRQDLEIIQSEVAALTAGPLLSHLRPARQWTSAVVMPQFDMRTDPAVPRDNAEILDKRAPSHDVMGTDGETGKSARTEGVPKTDQSPSPADSIPGPAANLRP